MDIHLFTDDASHKENKRFKRLVWLLPLALLLCMGAPSGRKKSTSEAKSRGASRSEVKKSYSEKRDEWSKNNVALGAYLDQLRAERVEERSNGDKRASSTTEK